MATISEALAIAIQHCQAGRFQSAEQIFRQILHVEPAYAVAHNNLGNVLQEQGKLEDAVECYRRALQLKPDYALAQSNLGGALQAQGKWDEAMQCYQRTLQLTPNFAKAHNNLGTVFTAQGKLDEAVACYRRALQLNPDYAEAHYNLGIAFKDQGKLDEAIACCRQALALKPDYAEAHNNLGTAFKDQGQLEEAIACYYRALTLRPDYVEAHSNLGNAFKDQGKLEEAIACYRRALEVKPDFAEAHLNRALTWLLAGDWQQGWPEYEWRWWASGMSPRSFQEPLWDGNPLTGEAILLHAEQGLGDTIQFIRSAGQTFGRRGRRGMPESVAAVALHLCGHRSSGRSRRRDSGVHCSGAAAELAQDFPDVAGCHSRRRALSVRSAGEGRVLAAAAPGSARL